MRKKYKFLHPPLSSQLFKHKTPSLLPCVKKSISTPLRDAHRVEDPLTLACKFPFPDPSPLPVCPQPDALPLHPGPALPLSPVIQAPERRIP